MDIDELERLEASPKDGRKLGDDVIYIELMPVGYYGYRAWLEADNEADLPLIAASPELYAALEAIVGWKIGDSPEEGERIMNMAKSALAKARGE